MCAVPAGGVMLMRPLLLHASHRSTSARPRRVVHLEFSAQELPAGLSWRERRALFGPGALAGAAPGGRGN